MFLYDSPVSGNCYKVRLLLAKLGTPYERRELSVTDRSERPQILGGLNPSLRIPVLVLDDGRAIGESNAILQYLAEGTRYGPSDSFERAQMLMWQFFEQYDVEPNIAISQWWNKSGMEVPERDRTAKREGGGKALRALEARLTDHDYLACDRFTIADIALYGYTHVAEEAGFALEPYPAMRAWLGRVAADPRHIAISD